MMVLYSFCCFVIFPAHSLQKSVTHPVLLKVKFWDLIPLLFNILDKFLHSICLSFSELLRVTPDHALVVSRFFVVNENVFHGWFVLEYFFSDVGKWIHVFNYFHISKIVKRFDLLLFFWAAFRLL